MSDTVPKRVPNFSSSETELLTTLVKRYTNVLENKKTDGANNQTKEETWSKLAEDFNSTSGLNHRNAETLRAKYENIKKTFKRKYGDHRRSLYRTRGGPPQDILNLTQEEEIIMELAGPSINGLTARFDTDKILECEAPLPVVAVASTSECTMQSEDIHIPDEFKIEVEMNSKQDLGKGVVATPQREEYARSTPNRFVLKKKQSNPLLRRNPEAFVNTMGSYSDLSKKKQDLVNAQLRNIEEKTRQEKIEHELRCAHLQEKLKQATKEHQLRSELIMLDIALKKNYNKMNKQNNSLK